MSWLVSPNVLCELSLLKEFIMLMKIPVFILIYNNIWDNVLDYFFLASYKESLRPNLWSIWFIINHINGMIGVEYFKQGQAY